MELTPLTIRFIDGTAFTFLMLIAVVGALLANFRSFHRLSRCGTLAVLTCAAAFSATATPLPLWFLALYWFAVLGLCIVAVFTNHAVRPLRGFSLAIIALSLGALLSEHRATRPGIAPPYQERPIIVLGDSLSSGLHQGETTWPVRLAVLLETPVNNRARAGARMVDGQTQIESLDLSGSLVIVFLGGNDLIAMRPPQSYERQLRSLVENIQSQEAEPVLLAFPSLPFNAAYARSLRRVARKADVPVIPHTLLSNTLARPENTTDGLHLSDAGHASLAAKVARWFKENQ